MSEAITQLVTTAAHVFNEGFRLPNEGAGKRASIYISPIDAVAPLTVPEARRLLYSKALNALLTEMGYEVQCHSLFADYEQPVKSLTVSIWLRYLELCGENLAYPEDCYQGDYIFDFAATVHRTYSNLWHVAAKDVEELLSQVHSCADLYPQIQEWLGDEAVLTIRQIGVHGISGDIRSDLQEISVDFESWPRASALLRAGIATEAMNRFEAIGLHNDNGYRDIKLSEKRTLMMENQAGLTPLAIQLSHFLSLLDKEGADSDLNIVIYDIDESETVKQLLHGIQLLGYPVASFIEKPMSSPQLLEMGEIVHTSPLAEDFVSFREVRQTMGLTNVQWLFAIHKSNVSVQIDLSKEHADVIIQQCRGVAEDSSHQNIIGDLTQCTNALDELTPSQRKQAESILQIISEFQDVARQTRQYLEPALLVNYYRNLCESFLSYYNNHELISPINEQHDIQWANTDEWIAAIMTSTLTRLRILTDSMVSSQ